jgi:hypothetical protein
MLLATQRTIGGGELAAVDCEHAGIVILALIWSAISGGVTFRLPAPDLDTFASRSGIAQSFGVEFARLVCSFVYGRSELGRLGWGAASSWAKQDAAENRMKIAHRIVRSLSLISARETVHQVELLATTSTHRLVRWLEPLRACARFVAPVKNSQYQDRRQRSLRLRPSTREGLLGETANGVSGRGSAKAGNEVRHGIRAPVTHGMDSIWNPTWGTIFNIRFPKGRERSERRSPTDLETG